LLGSAEAISASKKQKMCLQNLLGTKQILRLYFASWSKSKIESNFYAQESKKQNLYLQNLLAKSIFNFLSKLGS
jgi:hypothetical protein